MDLIYDSLKENTLRSKKHSKVHIYFLVNIFLTKFVVLSFLLGFILHNMSVK